LFLFNLIVKTIQKYFAGPYIVKISLKRVEMNFCPGSKNSINGKTARYDGIINELCHFYKVSLIKAGLMFHKYHLLNQLQVFMRYKNLPK
jgi:hypothetical protein